MKVARYLEIRRAVVAAGYGLDIGWSEGIRPPGHPDAFALEVAYVICNSGMRWQIARGIYIRVRAALMAGEPVAAVFGHAGKAAAIEWIWARRRALWWRYRLDADKVGWLGQLPWVGPITRWHLYKNFGGDCVKPDRWLERIARAHGTTPVALCRGLAQATGDRVATVDMVLWRAAVLGLHRLLGLGAQAELVV